MSQGHTLTWQDVLPAAEEIYRVWVGGGDLAWAEGAWGHVVRAGLAEYQTPLERCRACFRFLSMATIYFDFCTVACDECHDDLEIWYGADELEMDPLNVGQLVGPEELPGDDETEALFDAYDTLTHKAREEVLAALLKGYGGPIEFLKALWRSTERPHEDGDEMSAEVIEWELPDDWPVRIYADAYTMQTVGWMDNGFPRYRP